MTRAIGWLSVAVPYLGPRLCSWHLERVLRRRKQIPPGVYRISKTIIGSSDGLVIGTRHGRQDV
jgi:hypothetical protein